MQGITTQISAAEQTTLHPFCKPWRSKQKAFKALFNLLQSVSGQLNCLLGFTAYKGNLQWLSQKKVADTNIF